MSRRDEHALDLETVLALADAGWALHPIAPGLKVPVTRNGLRDATRDPDQLAAWHVERPDLRWGTPTATVADIDRPDDVDLEFPDDAPRQQTPSGGSHVLMAATHQRLPGKLPGDAGEWRADGKAYVVIYEPRVFIDNPPDTLPPVPEAAFARTSAPRADDEEKLEAVSENRNQWLAHLAGSLRGAGASINETEAAIRLANTERCVPPLSKSELERTVLKSMRTWERGEVILPPRLKHASTKADGTFPKLETINARDLIDHPPDQPIEIVPGLIPAGLPLLASAPKVGKSWLAYQLCLAVATGGEVLGRHAEQGDVLYLALEDGMYRAWSRITSILDRTTGRSKMPANAADLEVAFLAGRGDELVNQVEEWLARHPDAAMVVIDTLQRVRPGASGRRNQYELDVEDVGRVLGITKRHPRLALPVVHHDTKASRTPGSDFVDAISGTSGIGGSVDTILHLRRQRHAAVGTLDVTGKDIPEVLLHLAYEEASPFWTIDPLGGMTESQVSAFHAIKEHGPIGTTALGDELDITKQSAQALADALLEIGAVVKDDRGKYRVPFRTRRSSSTDRTDETDETDRTDTTDSSCGRGRQSSQSSQSGTRTRTRTTTDDRLAARARRAR